MPCVFCGNPEAPGILKSHHPCQLSDGEPCSPCKEIQELEPQIAQAKDALHEMLIRYCELRKQMNRSHNPIIHNLPPEILSHIFELSIPERPLGVSSRGLSQIEIRAPLTLGSICQVWRHIAFSTPQLWTTISLYLGNNLQFEKTAPTHYKLATQWLSRSGELPLSIYIYGDKHTNGPDIQPFMDLVNQHSSRWRHLELELPHHLASYLHGNSSGTCILHSLRLHRSPKVKSQTIDPNAGFFALSNARPRPKIVFLRNWPLNRIVIELKHATNVNLENPSVSDCIAVLQCAPNLTCFKFTNTPERLPYSHIDFDLVAYAIPTTPIIRPLLQELHIGVRNRKLATEFVNSFTLPGLQILTILANSSFSLDILTSLVNRSSCHLTTLSIDKTAFHNTEILPLLRATPSVRNLDFSWSSYTGLLNAIETLTSIFRPQTDTYGQLLPVLESLSLSVLHESKNPLPWIILSKKLTGALSLHQRPLEKFDLSFIWYDVLGSSEYIDEESIHHFLELKEAGIALHFGIRHKKSPEHHIDEFDLLQLSLEHHSKSNNFSDSSW